MRTATKSERRDGAGAIRAARRALLGGSVILAATSCGDVPVESDTFVPQGNFRGNVVYSGPLPCTENVRNPDTGEIRSHVLGAAALLVFNENLLPPPEGFGTTAAQLGVVSGDLLFASITDQLVTLPLDREGISCPDPTSTVTATVSAPFTIGPVPAGRWQIRAFYDYDGDFAPLERLHQLPTAGDIGGGAIANTVDALAGKPVKFQSFEMGVHYDNTGKLVMPSSGALIDGVSVTLGQKLAFARPIFHFGDPLDERPGTCADPTAAPGETKPAIPCSEVCKDPNDPTGKRTLCSLIGGAAEPPIALQNDSQHLVLPQDERFAISPTNPANASIADSQFIRVHLGASLPAEEKSLAAAAPYFLQSEPPYDTLYTYPNVDDAGVIKAIPESPPGLTIADMFPQLIFGKLDERDPRHQTAQASPAVVIQGINIYGGSLLKTLSSAVPKAPTAVSEIVGAIRPSVICLDPLDVTSTVYVVTPSFKSLDGDLVVDPTTLAPKIVKQLGNRPNVAVVEGCLPKGIFQANLVYPTGQAWTMPNEAGACMPLEGDQGSTCIEQGTHQPRTVLVSQSTVLTIGDEREPGYCDSLKAPADHPELTYVHGVPTVCLRPEQIP